MCDVSARCCVRGCTGGLWTRLDWVVAELGAGHRLEALASLGQVGVALDPAHGVQVQREAAADLPGVLRVL